MAGQGSPRDIRHNGAVTDRYAVIGNPISHSKSPEIHRAFARAAGIELEYMAIECPRDRFAAELGAFRRDGGRGVNVTAPFKVEAFEIAEDRSERAEIAGAVNTLAFEGAMVRGDNFDGIGLVRDIQDNLGFAVGGRRVLVLGAGGAVRGVLQPLLDAGPAELTLANRSPGKAREVAGLARRGGPVRAGDYDDVGDQAFDLVINATSASVAGELPPLAATAFAEGSVAYELAYGLGMTPFLELAKSAGAGRVVDGVGMLVEQAAEAFAWWRGIRPDTRAMIDLLTIPLA